MSRPLNGTKDRINKLRDFMIKNHIDLILIESEMNRYYFTDFRSSEGSLIITLKESILMVDSRFYEAARKTLKENEVLESNNRDEFIKEFCKNKKYNRILIEEERIFAKRFKELKYLTDNKIVEDISLDSYIQLLRRKKDKREIEYLRKAQQIADQTFFHMLEYIKPGITENDIKMELGLYMVKLGSQNYGMNFLVTSGENTSLPHGGGKNRIIQKGDLITMDFGGQIHGYSSDMTRTVALGWISEEKRRVYEIVKEAQDHAMKYIAPRAKCKDIDKLARGYINSHELGQYFGHGLGHSLGLEIHENPRFNQSSKDILEVGDIMTVEPGIYLPGDFGVRIEDMILITEGGFENMTKAPKDLIVI